MMIGATEKQNEGERRRSELDAERSCRSQPCDRRNERVRLGSQRHVEQSDDENREPPRGAAVNVEREELLDQDRVERREQRERARQNIGMLSNDANTPKTERARRTQEEREPFRGLDVPISLNMAALSSHGPLAKCACQMVCGP